MFHVKAKETTVTIGTRVFSPAVATCFQDELPPEVAERIDLLSIEEVPDAESMVDAGGLSATGTLQTGHEGGPAAGPEAVADGLDGEGAGDDANPEDGMGTGDASHGQADPTILSDKALQEGVTVLDGEDVHAPDPFADPAPASAEDKPSGGRARGNRK